MPIEMHIKKQGYAFLFSQAIKIHENNMSNLSPGIMLTLSLLPNNCNDYYLPGLIFDTKRLQQPCKDTNLRSQCGMTKVPHT